MMKEARALESHALGNNVEFSEESVIKPVVKTGEVSGREGTRRKVVEGNR